MFSGAKRRAAVKGIPFNITLDDLQLSARCPVLGIPLDFSSCSPTDYSPSLDRVIPCLGYVKGDVIIVSNRANRIKSDATVGELQQVANFYSEWIRKELV